MAENDEIQYLRGRIAQLEAEREDLRVAREDVIEEFQTSNEDLKSTNEKLRANLELLDQRSREQNAEFHDANNALARSGEDLRGIFEKSHVGMTLQDEAGYRIMVNQAFADMLGCSTEELVGSHITAFTHPDDIAMSETVLEQWNSGKSRNIGLEKRLLRKDGTTVWVSSNITAFELPGRDSALAISHVMDITDHKTAERALAESEARYRSTFESAVIGIVIINEIGTVDNFNATAEKIFGYGADEVIGQNIRMLMPEPDRSQHDGYIQGFLKTGEAKIIGKGREVIGLRKNGEAFPMHLGIGEVSIEDRKSFVGSIVDLTELHALRGQLVQAQKMEAIGQLTGGIAHDFNNILGIIMGNLQLMQRQIIDAPDVLARLESALDGTRRAADITNKLLAFSSQNPSDVRLVVVNDFVEHMKDLIARSLTAYIKVDTHLADDLWLAKIDPGDLEDAVLNLSLNARDAMPDGGTLRIETANKVLDQTYAAGNPAVRPGEFVMIAISDTGIGMTDEVKERVFEPFFTTKEAGRGSGLGLSMVYGFVERSDGHIDADTKLGVGTTIRIYLPRAHDETTAGETAPRHQLELPRGSETILIVDDEDFLRDVAVSFLEDLGYVTVTAKDAQEALDILNDQDGIDLLFCDVIMPGVMDGYQVALAAHDIHPSLKVLLTSGFTRKREENTHGEAPYLTSLTRNLLRKPYDFDDLANAVRRILDDGHR